jgi:hypothetical protein
LPLPAVWTRTSARKLPACRSLAWGFLGQSRVNVLLLNVALDEMAAGKKADSVAQRNG